MKVFIRSLVCFLLLLISTSSMIYGSLLMLGFLQENSRLDGLGFFFIGIVWFVGGYAMAWTLLGDMLLIKKYGHKEFKQITKGSPIHKIFPFFGSRNTSRKKE